MTDEQILATADACGMMLFGLGLDKAKFEFFILAFAKQIAAKATAVEREACAKVCDELHWPWHIGDNSGPKQCAIAIRARGEQA